MAEYTYEWPNAQNFYAGVRAVIQSQYSYEKTLCSLIDSGYCEFYDTTNFSRNRWDAYYAEVHFFIPINAYSEYCDLLDNYQDLLLDVCRKIMPPDAGYDIMKVTISPILSSQQQKDSLVEIKEIIEDKKYLNISDDLIDKGKKMANAYISLYVLENYIRQYIDKKLTDSIGPNYFDTIPIPQKIRKGMESRKAQEQEKKWLPLRGENDLYYLDFIDLADFIVANWNYFKDDIKDQHWISVKMKEMYDIRCLIAHNSYISDDNIQLLDVTTKQILAQLG